MDQSEKQKWAASGHDYHNVAQHLFSEISFVMAEQSLPIKEAAVKVIGYCYHADQHEQLQCHPELAQEIGAENFLPYFEYMHSFNSKKTDVFLNAHRVMSAFKKSLDLVQGNRHTRNRPQAEQVTLAAGKWVEKNTALFKSCLGMQPA